MIFDLFHSISDPQIQGSTLGAKRVFNQFLEQVTLAEALGFDTVWCAESHFSSETQKQTSVGTILGFKGEVGLNSDSFQIAHLILERTKRINFGTAIHNIVGGSGGPIASADRVNQLSFLNSHLEDWQRKLRIGVAAGRFPYQNTPFGIVPRNEFEKENWTEVKRYIFLEALEIFLRLLSEKEVHSGQIKQWKENILPRWNFESVSLVPYQPVKENLEIVLGSHDPLAVDWGLNFWDLSLFNLSFTAPDQIEKLQEDMATKAKVKGREWSRDRLPRTVMVFIDKDRKKAYDLADQVLDNYIEAMRGTAQVPSKDTLLSRALVGDPSEIRDQLKGTSNRGLHPEDRLLLWFEFNQSDNKAIQNQMRLFSNEVIEKL